MPPGVVDWSAGGGVVVVSAGGGVAVLLSGAGGAVVESAGGGGVSDGDGFADCCFAQADASSNAPTVRNKTLRFIRFTSLLVCVSRTAQDHRAHGGNARRLATFRCLPVASERAPCSTCRACAGKAKLEHGHLLFFCAR